MIRKWMTVLLSLLLAVALPISALADTQHTLTVVPGAEMASQQEIADLLDVLNLRLTQGERSGALSVLLNDQELVTLGLTADSTGLYAASGVFGADVLYVTWEDGFAFLADQVLGRLKDSGADEASLQSIETAMEEAKNAIVTAAGTGITVVEKPAAPVSMEESIALIKEMFPDDPEMVKYIAGIYSNMTIENGSFVSEKRDEADQKYRMVMDEDDLIAVCDTNYMRAMMLEMLASEKPEATEAELNSAADEMLAEVKELYQNSGFEMVMEMYTQDEGMALVGMDLTTTMNIDTTETGGEELHTAMQMTATYNRLTDADGVCYALDGEMKVDQDAVKIAFELDRGNNGVSNGLVGLLADGEELVFTYQAENTAAETRERKVEMYMRSGASAILPPAAADRPLIGFELVTEPADEAVLEALETAKPETSVNLMKLSDSAMQALGNQIMGNAMQVFYTALGQLPTSVIGLMMSSAE